MGAGPAIALIDGEHHPAALRAALDRLAAEREIAGVVFCGGEEKVGPAVLRSAERHYGRPVMPAADGGGGAEGELRRLAEETPAQAVVDLADEPVLRAGTRLRLAAHAVHLGLSYEAPGMRLDPPRYAPVAFECPKVAVIGTGKRSGKTAVAGHLAALLRERGVRPVIVAMGRGGPAEPQIARAGTSLEELRRICSEGGHAASDYLEDAVLAGVPTVGCRRVGGGLAGEPYESNVVEGAALAASLEPEAMVFEGSGACIPPVEVDRTVCMVGDRAGALDALGPYRLLRADLALVLGDDATLAAEVAEICPGETMRCSLDPEPAEVLDPAARVAVFSTSEAVPAGIEPCVHSSNLARRSLLEKDLDRAAAEGCEVYLTELKAAAIGEVAAEAAGDGARVVFMRNRPTGVDGDLDEALLRLVEDA